jgi:hypothetical protein
MSKRFKGSELGYHGKGTPNSETLAELQLTYRNAAIGRGLPPKILQQYIHMLGLEAKARRRNDEARVEAERIAMELKPFLYFDPEDVDWNS